MWKFPDEDFEVWRSRKSRRNTINIALYVGSECEYNYYLPRYCNGIELINYWFLAPHRRYSPSHLCLNLDNISGLPSVSHVIHMLGAIS